MNRKMLTTVICARSWWLPSSAEWSLPAALAAAASAGASAAAASMVATAAFMGVTEVDGITAGCRRSAGHRRLAQPARSTVRGLRRGYELWKSREPPKACTGASSTTVPARVPTPRRGEGPSTTAPRESPAAAPRAAWPAGVSTESQARRPAAGPTRMSVVPAGRSDLVATRSPGVRTSAAVSGPRGTAVDGSRIRGFRVRRSLRRRVLRRRRVPAQRLQRLRGVSPGLGPRLLERPRLRGLGMAQPVLGRRLGLGGWGWVWAWGWAGACRPGASARPSTAWATCRTPTPTTPLLTVARRAAMAAPYNYSQPIDTVSAAPRRIGHGPRDGAVRRRPRVVQAGQLRPTPCNRPTMRWRSSPTTRPCTSSAALCLFALGRYDESAATLYAVLSVGPGWDWTTLIGLYPDVSTSTRPSFAPWRATARPTRTRPPPGSCLPTTT